LSFKWDSLFAHNEQNNIFVCTFQSEMTSISRKMKRVEIEFWLIYRYLSISYISKKAEIALHFSLKRTPSTGTKESSDLIERAMQALLATSSEIRRDELHLALSEFLGAVVMSTRFSTDGHLTRHTMSLAESATPSIGSWADVP
jgi:hypothetical protein